MIDSISSQRAETLHPKLRAMFFQHADELFGKEKCILRMTEGYRPIQDQANIFASGRTAPGSILTNARAGQSWHQYGLAYDCVPLIGTVPDWNSQHRVWKTLVEIGDSIGLAHVNVHDRNGYRRDWPHFQLKEIPLSPSIRIESMLSTGRSLGEIWNELNI